MSTRHYSFMLACLYCLLFVSTRGLAREPIQENSESLEHHTRLQSWLSTYSSYPDHRDIPARPAGCRLLHLNHLGRHGSRNPMQLEDVLTLANEYEVLAETRPLTRNGSRLRLDIHRMTDWLLNNPVQIARLTEKGINEELALGQRAAQMLRSEIRQNQQLSIATGTSPIERAQHSLKVFQEGLSQGLGKDVHILANPIMPEEKMTEMLTPFLPLIHCPRLEQVLVPLEKSTTSEYLANLSHSRPKIVTRFADQLIPGLSDAQATHLTITLFQLCQFENPMDQSFNICNLFTDWTPDNSWLELVQWLGDVVNHIYYYKMGPAVVMDGIQSSVGMPILQHFLETTDAAARHKSDVRAHFRFAHDATLSPLLQSIGIIKTRGTEEERYLSWNSSRQLPMAANLYWQLYECHEGLRIRMLLNEKVEPFPFPPCSEQELCDWQAVKRHYQHADYRDRMKEACSIDKHDASSLTPAAHEAKPSAPDMGYDSGNNRKQKES